jgi:hypothetical protein
MKQADFFPAGFGINLSASVVRHAGCRKILVEFQMTGSSVRSKITGGLRLANSRARIAGTCAKGI